MQKIMVTATRIFLGAIFFTSGMAKLTHGDFIGIIGPAWLEQRIAPYGLGLWAQFVGWSQVVIGLLLLSQRFALLGAIMLVPMLANIFVITISLQWRGTPYVNAVLLMLNLFLLAADWEKLKPIVAGSSEKRTADALALSGIALGVLSPALYGIHRVLTFSSAILAVGMFALARVRNRHS